MRVRIKAETRSFCPKKCGLRKGDLAEVVEEEYEPENLILGCLGGRFVGVYVPNPMQPGKTVFLLGSDVEFVDGPPPRDKREVPDLHLLDDQRGVD
jgi:hypothetical protein